MLRQRVLECGRGDCDGFDFGEASIRALRSCSAQFDNNDFKLISHIWEQFAESIVILVLG